MSQKTEDQRPGHRPSWTTERASRYFLSPSFAFSMGLPSVRQSPLPLQSFLPLVVPQPPLPLQEFCPLQACFSFLLLVAFLPESAGLPPVSCAIAAVVPATNPDRAAPITNARIDFVIEESPFVIYFRIWPGVSDRTLPTAGPDCNSRPWFWYVGFMDFGLVTSILNPLNLRSPF